MLLCFKKTDLSSFPCSLRSSKLISNAEGEEKHKDQPIPKVDREEFETCLSLESVVNNLGCDNEHITQIAAVYLDRQ